jgi:hypothetical protein
MNSQFMIKRVAMSMWMMTKKKLTMRTTNWEEGREGGRESEREEEEKQSICFDSLVRPGTSCPVHSPRGTGWGNG